MTITASLSNEHRVIEQVLNCLEKMVQKAAAKQELDWIDAGKALDFFKVFADQCHHRKEEDHLFRRLEARGFSRAFGPTGVMLHEHEEGRQYVRGMSAAITQAAAQPQEALEQFVQYAQAYIALLRQHIYKEDHCLFPMADQVLAGDELEMEREFDEVEHAHFAEGTHERYLQIADELAARYDVMPSVRPTVRCACGHH
jgi:hemerythrin-like domain-containing protein